MSRTTANSSLNQTASKTEVPGTEVSGMGASGRGNPGKGTIIHVSSAIVDVVFPLDAIPAIHNELTVVVPATENQPERIVNLEVEQQRSDGIVRCIVFESTLGIARGLEVTDTGSPIQVPVGPETLGRVFNVLGQAIDGKPPVEATEQWSIYREAPLLIEQKNCSSDPRNRH